ncbi:hypothetical protein FPOAC2_07081 [Fusarium poae]|uniref:Uncharacterized protein n=2 Tax=Fusarium poae TaxID=36050 RepID=A0A1B8AZA0_FUSPO|nr:hypothetical protein FPOA_06354 [Fusarium poae]
MVFFMSGHHHLCDYVYEVPVKSSPRPSPTTQTGERIFGKSAAAAASRKRRATDGDRATSKLLNGSRNSR